MIVIFELWSGGGLLLKRRDVQSSRW